MNKTMMTTIINLRSTTFTSWKAGQPKESSREVQDCVGLGGCIVLIVIVMNDDHDEEVEDEVGGKIPLLTTLTVTSVIRKLCSSLKA